MAIRTFSTQEKYREGGTEPRKKLKRVRSVKVANLDRLRLSMRREKSRFNCGVKDSLDDATDPSESSSAGISGTSSPNYMKATTSSSARKGSLQASSGNFQSSSASSNDPRTTEKQDNPASSAKSASKLNKVSVQECSDPAGVNNIPVIVKPDKSLKRVPSFKHPKKLSSKKSMKIRARYSQFPDVGTSKDEMLSLDILEFRGDTESEINGGGMEIDSESPNVSASDSQDTMVKRGARQRGILERSRSRKLTRLRSIRSSKTRQKPQFRFSGGATELMSHEAEESNAEPHYMKGTSSQELKKNSDKFLTRTSSLRPLRILAKIPSLRSTRSKVRKRPQATSLSGTSVDRATCSSILKRTELPDDIEFHSSTQELEGTSSFHVCPYSYCSVHGHRHHAPSQSVTEFISAKRKLCSNQKSEKTKSQFREEVEHHHTRAAESDQSGQIFSAENYAVQEVMDANTESVTEAEDNGIDFLVKIYAKPRKTWSEALNMCTYDQISVGDYEGKVAETLSETSGSEETQETLNDNQQEKHESFKQHQNSNIAALILPSDHLHLASRDSAVNSGGDPLNIFSDKQKYTSMWRLIHQQLLSNEASLNEATEVIPAEEKEGEDGNTCREMSDLDPEQSECSNNLSDDVNPQIAVTEKLESHQTAAIKLVQEALNAILQCDAESNNQQSNPVQEMANSFDRGSISTPTASQEETFREGGEIDGRGITLASAETKHNMKQIGNKLLQKEPDSQEMSGRQMSKSLSKLRKMFVTAKFIKVMERLKKINPRKPQYLSSEDEKVNLRHLSMNEKKNTEEWMLDNALRQVISGLDPDQQRRVAQLVEAFETVIPEKEEKSNKRHPMNSVLAPGSKLTIPMIGEKKQFMEPEQKQDISLSYEQVIQQQDGVLVSHKGAPQEQRFREEHEDQAITTGDKNLQKSNETTMPDSTLVGSEKNSESVCVDSGFDDVSTNNEEATNTLKVPPQFPTKYSEVNLAGDMTTIFVNKLKYKSMWNMIYRHVVSTEASISENQQVNGFNEEQDGDTNNSQEMNDRDSISSDYSIDQNEDADNESAACEKPELDQSAAIKLVKEALGAILDRYELQTHLQSIPEHYRASNDARDLDISTPTSSTEEASVVGGKRVKKHTYSDVEHKMQHVENTSLPLQQQVKCDELKAPQRKMSKSLSKLKKAIATARFIKAMERLTKSSPHKSQNLSSDTTSEEERVYLRHRSMDGRKNGEEWMLDFALRQVISKMAPDQQRRVVRLVEAFETVHPEQKGKDISLKGEAADQSGLANSINEARNCCLKSQQQRFTYVKQVPQKQKDGSPLPTGDVSQERSLQEDHDQQVSAAKTTTRDASLERNLQEYQDQQINTADDIILQEINETAISESALDLSGNGSKLASVDVKLEEPSIRDKESWRANEFPSLIPTANSEVKPDDNMATILFDKQKYTSMWHLIHQHVLSNEASKDGKQKIDEIDEVKQSEDTCQEINNPEPTQSAHLKKSEVDKDNQSPDLEQSAAINLVKEAINAILQRHDQTSDQQSLKDHGRDADSCDTTALAFTKENCGGKKMVKQGNPEEEEKLHKVDVTNAPFQQHAEAKKSQKKMSTSISKLKKAIATAKFIKAMERLRKMNPRKLQHLSTEMASEEERVHLRHLSINERKNDEEWMLDYALRKVLSNLAPEAQRKVALIVEAFETVRPEQKDIRNVTKSEWEPAVETESMTDDKRILEPKHNSSTSSVDDIPSMRNDRLKSLNMFDKGATLENSKQEDHSIKFSNHKREMSSEILESDDFNFHIHHQTSSKGSSIGNSWNKLTVRKEETGANPGLELLEHTKDPEQDTKINITKAIFSENQKNTSMWHLIYQHVNSITAEEAECKMSERLANEDQMNRGGTSAEKIADANPDDNDASSMTGELSENDATKLVREAINDILNAPEDPESSNRTTGSEEGQRTAAEEKPTKSLSKGYSKLRKLIICNKFIKAMEQTQKHNPQKLISPAFNSDSESGKAHLKTGAVGERKGMDEWMLDNVLQKVIAGLAPVQQRRVSLLVEAFEKVPDSEQRGKGLSCSKTEFLDTTSKGHTKEKEDTISSTNAGCHDGFGIKLDESTTSSREATTERIPQEICKDSKSGLTIEYALNGGNWRSDGPCNITATTSDAASTLSDACKDPTDIDGAHAPHVPLEERTKIRNEAGAQCEAGTWVDEELTRNTEQASKFANKSPQPEDLEDEWNYSAHKGRSSEKSTSLWGLILQQVTTDMLEKNEAPKTGEIDADAQRDSTTTLERRKGDSSQASFKPKSFRDMGVQTPTSFEFQENQAIKLVEEAVEEILLLQDHISDTKSMTSSTTLEQEIYCPNNGDVIEPSLAAIETGSIATSIHTTATPEEEKLSSKEELPKSYNALSKVILCKRFVKAMDKMRKLKALSTQDTSQPSHAEKKGIPSLRQISTSDKTSSWEEGTLDNALQKVIGNLAPAKKQRVALLVQAFETVGSQPESANSSRNKPSI